MAKKEYQCSSCGAQFKRYQSLVRNPEMVFCNKTCKGLYFRGKNTGSANPNFNNKWSQEQKDAASIRSKNWHDNDDGTWLEKNRNRTWTDEGKRNIGESARVRLTGTTFKHTNETKLKIGEKSSAKFTNNYKIDQRATMEQRGYWIPLDLIDPFERYTRAANWVKPMFDLDILGSDLLKENGIFNSKTNSKGVVRDHRYGRREGYKSGVYPEILRHPANCEILLHSDNIKKGKSTNDCSITIDELFNDIVNYDGVWHEQEVCLELIEKYKQGKRFKS